MKTPEPLVVVVLGDKLGNRHHHKKRRAEVRVRPDSRGRLLTRYGGR